MKMKRDNVQSFPLLPILSQMVAPVGFERYLKLLFNQTGNEIRLYLTKSSQVKRYILLI